MKYRTGKLQPLHTAKTTALVTRLRPDMSIEAKGTVKVVNKRMLPPKVPRFSTGTMLAKCDSSEGRHIPIKKPRTATEKIPKAIDIVEKGRSSDETIPKVAHTTKKRNLRILLKRAAPTT